MTEAQAAAGNPEHYLARCIEDAATLAKRPIPEIGPSQVDLMTGGGDVQSVRTTARVRRGRPVRVRTSAGTMRDAGTTRSATTSS